MDEQKPPKAILRWTSKLLQQIFNLKTVEDPLAFRKQVIGQVDERGLSFVQAAALQAAENTEDIKKKVDDLLTPRPGEKANLERILTLLESIAKSQIATQKLIGEVLERLVALEAQIFVSNAVSPNLDSANKSTG